MVKISKSSIKMRQIIEKAIDEHYITHDDYNNLIHIATEDSTIDPHEKILFKHLQDMLEDRTVKFKPA